MSFLRYLINSLPFSLLTHLPSTKTSPLVKLSIPPKIFKQVVFPAPEGPKIQTNSPLFILKEVFESALISTSPIL